jgi:hypothetical protein
MLDFGGTYSIKVSIGQFYGIEINDFAVTVAKTALWISEEQMIRETQEIIHTNIDFLPLKSYANIVQGNALRMEWERVISKENLSFIMGNPPFVGYTYQSVMQKDDLSRATSGLGKNIDYVSGWYYKASQFIENTEIKVAFVSTNSITQGEQVSALWKILFRQFKIHIDFAHRTFRWDSEANLKAHVHCVIIGFSNAKTQKRRKLYDKGTVICARNINAYLTDAPNVFIEKRANPICPVPKMVKGSQPTDGGNLILSQEEKELLLEKYPFAERLVHRFMGADEFINDKVRYCLWLENVPPKKLKSCKPIYDRVEKVREFRENSKKLSTRKWAEKPTEFTENRQPKTEYIIVPSVSSEQRRYIPIGFIQPDIVASNLVLIVPNASLYLFGVLTSNVHMAWMRTVCGRLKSDYRYSNTIVYNNFPWPSPSSEQKAKIEQTAQGILDARALYPDSSLADLYDPLTMPPELRKAHDRNNVAVMKAYGFPTSMSEADCVAALMKMYQELTEKA